MKISFSRRELGFTLVELLVVISIIAVLASAGFAAGNAAIQKARKTTTLATVKAIENAVNNFYTDYGTMPTAETTETEVKTNEPAGVAVLNVLLGVEPSTTASPLNAKAVNYLNVKQSKAKADNPAPKDGLVRNADGTAKGLYDPWGGSYTIRMDADLDEKVTPQPRGTGSASTVLFNTRVAVWSDGADGAGTAAGKASDDVKSW